MTNMFLCTIAVSAPEYGIALVYKQEGTRSMSELFAARLPYQDTSTDYGTDVQRHYAVGTTVVCCAPYTDHSQLYIIGTANALTQTPYDSLNGRVFYACNDFTEHNDSNLTHLLNKMLETVRCAFHNYAHGIEKDALPGDCDIVDKQEQIGLHVGRLLVQLRASTLAYIDISNLYNKIRAVAETAELHTLTSEYTCATDVEIKRKAINVKEAIGLTEASYGQLQKAFEAGEMQDTTSPVYRLQSMSGALADGHEHVVLSPYEESVNVLYKRREDLGGNVTEESAQSICHLKTPAINCILTDRTDTDEEQEESKEEATVYDISDAALHKLTDMLLSSPYIDTLVDALKAKGFSVSDGNAEMLSAFTDGAKTYGATNKQQYDMPAFITITDPVTGKQYAYYNTASFISQESDGSILICDGYGSEIRMSRGNIYISPALDLFFRTGRDMSAMVPRHMCLNAQKTVTLNSSDTVYIRAEKDLQETSNKGSVIIDCKSNAGRLAMHSTSSVSITGQDLYIGRNNGTGTSTEGVTAPDRSGIIIIDACDNGKIYMHSDEHEAIAKRHTIAAVTNAAGTNNSACIIDGNRISIISQAIYAPASFKCKKALETDTISMMVDGKTIEAVLSRADTPSIEIDGSLVVNGSVVCNESIRAISQIVARSMATESGLMYKVAGDIGVIFKKQEIIAVENIAVGASVSSALKAAATTVYQDKIIADNRFRFQSDYGINPSVRIPGMRWQSSSRANNQTYVWTEQSVYAADGTETMCYPGMDVWNTATVSDADMKQYMLKDSYIINTER